MLKVGSIYNADYSESREYKIKINGYYLVFPLIGRSPKIAAVIVPELAVGKLLECNLAL